MAILTGAVVVLSAVTIINLLLLGAVLRRLREREQRSAAGPRPVEIEIGTVAPEFVAVTADGARFGSDDLRSGSTLLGFFSDVCKPCVTEAPELADRAPGLAADGITVVPVLAVGSSGRPQELLPVLA